MWDPFIIVFLVDLILYHIWLKYKNLTTYDHIMLKREQEEEKQRNINFNKKSSMHIKKQKNRRSKVIKEINKKNEFDEKG